MLAKEIIVGMTCDKRLVGDEVINIMGKHELSYHVMAGP